MTIFDSARAVEFFAERLAFQTDAADVRAAMAGGDPGFVLVDTRNTESWDHGHIPGAIHLPHADIAKRARDLIDPAAPVVAYCWGPGCNGATRAALAFAREGYAVREMLGGIEYWIREGGPLRTAGGEVRRPADPLTSPVHGPSCGC
ncbi:rhodanese-like domain-containing protein [Jidongwangia harbinensis]|uniref:rhodanese-like domain-containing protein n=1 Tax=Jidongwangia harbinensis TaxID=2878561 RepID=UPI001CDA3A20|nr:rhodanese-like domain-containing protein [Jidongwangia harbinensis]MCA2215554.1 rhodanese-like domain-containing protein [Jidongwangia harbinensis]